MPAHTKKKIETYILFATGLIVISVVFMPLQTAYQAACPAGKVAVGATCTNDLCGGSVAAGDSCGTTDATGTCQTPSGAAAGTFTCTAASGGGGSKTQTTTPGPVVRNLPNPLGTNSLNDVIARAISILTSIAGSLALLMFVYGGVLWLTSQGEKNRIDAGRTALTYATIGLLIIFGSYAILRAVLKTILGANL